MPDLKTYVITTNCVQTAIIVAESEKQAIEMFEKQAKKDYCEGYDFVDATEINEYFSTGFYNPDFFGWIVNNTNPYK